MFKLLAFDGSKTSEDAERALLANKHRDDMRVGWGKSVEIPTHPIYIPNDLLKLYLPPLQTGLPFNAQPPENYQGKEIEDEHFLEKCSVKVTVPLNKKQLMLIHRMVEFVVREGPMFEAFIMNQEIRNSDYSFLFDYQSPLHIYYRWKVFSILNGDHQKSWRLEPFRMFKGGSIWLPPVAPDYTKGMPEELIKNTNVQGGQLSENQCARLIGLIRELTLNRTSVAEAMVFCVNHSGAIDDALEIILESLTNPDTRPVKKIARMYLFSDVVTNCRIRKVKLKLDDNLKELETVFDSMQDCYLKLSCAHDRDNFRNSDYSFLFDYQSPLHIYYRWKVFSILNGDHQKSWRLEPFRMFKGGSIWLPPVAPDYTKGMPEELIKNTNTQGGQLSENQCARLIGLIRELTLNRTSVAEAMVFCVNHSGAIDDALEIILESLTNPNTGPVKKIARMYLFSDVVTNCRIRKVKLKLDDNLKELEAVFDSMQDCYLKLSCAHDRDNFRYRIQRVITYWTMYNVFPRHALQKVDDYFTDTPVPIQEEDNSSSDEPLDGASLLKRSMKHNDIGPEVQVAPTQVKPRLKKSIDLEYFVPSKWDTVDPEEVEAQAMSTEKLYYMEAENQLKETKKKHKRRSKSKKLHR